MLKTLIAPFKRSGIQRFIIFSIDFGSRIVLQAGFFILLSRLVGPATLGAFASLTAISTLVACFVGLGSEQVMLRKISRPDFDLRREFGKCVTSTLYTAPPLLVAGSYASHLVNGANISVVSILLVFAADLILGRVQVVSACCLFARQANLRQLAVNLSLPFCRFGIAAVATLSSNSVSIYEWSWLYAASTLISALFSYIVAVTAVGAPQLDWSFKDGKEGFLFSLEFASLAAFRDLDKPTVEVSLGAAVAGSYAAAFRVVDTSCVPTRAYLQASYLKYFQLIEYEDPNKFYGYALKNLIIIILLGLVTGAGLLFVAPFVPFIIGPKYSEAVPAIIALSLHPVLIGATGVGSDVLRALGLQRLRLLSLILTYVSYVPVIYWGASEYGLIGASLARILLQAVLVLIIWGLVFFHYRQGAASRVPETLASEV